MKPRVAVIGAGVSGLTCAVLLAEIGYQTVIFAHEIGDCTNSAAAAAMWYPYDVAGDQVIAWALTSYDRFIELARDPKTGVSVTELRVFSRLGPITPPNWAQSFATRPVPNPEIPSAFVSGFEIRVPLIETGKYLEYLAARLTNAGASLCGGIRFNQLEDVDPGFDLIVDCAGIGARELVPDLNLEAHRGQVAIVQKFDLPYAVVCDDPPLMYAIPRSNDCVLGGTNDVSWERVADPRTTSKIIRECARILGCAPTPLIRERAGLRPVRSGGVRVAAEKLSDERSVIHNYGHGGAGFTLSWGCAESALRYVSSMA